MNIDNTLYTGRPTDQRSEVEMDIYDKLDSLGIDYQRADHEHADTMEDCLAIERYARTCSFAIVKRQTSICCLCLVINLSKRNF